MSDIDVPGSRSFPPDPKAAPRGGGRLSQVLPFWGQVKAMFRRDANRSLHPGAMRLRTLILLRWLAINGQTAAVVFIHFKMGFELPLWPCLAVIGASVWLNIILSSRFPHSKRLSETESALYLAFDIVQLSLLLMFTGGLQNPFCLLLLAPVTIAASTLHLRTALLLMALAFSCGTALALWYWPLPWLRGEPLIFPDLYIFGLWVALALGLSFMTFYAARIANEARRLSDALNAGQLALAQEQELSAVGGLAAAAAHELGTPLGSIYVVAKEMRRELPPDSPLMEDVEILVSEAERCRQILGQISQRPTQKDEAMKRSRFGALLEEIADIYRTDGVAIQILLEPDPALSLEDQQEPILYRSPEILNGLGNIIHNAADFAERSVTVVGKWTGDTVTVTVLDDGPGFSPAIIDRLGEPYVTSRARADDGSAPDEGGGMGLGFFIAKTMLERIGADLEIGNRPPPDRGARVHVRFQRHRVESQETGLFAHKL